MLAMTDASDSSGVDDAKRTDIWRQVLTGENPSLSNLRRGWSHIPSSPRCKLCAAPFKGPGRLLTRLLRHGVSSSSPLLCNFCFDKIRDYPGGAEIDLSVLFADIRGSTGIAERTSATGFSRLVQQFYAAAAQAIDRQNGVVDKFLGDGVMAPFIPVMTGASHAARAIDAGRAVLEGPEVARLAEGGARVGVGVHSGQAYVGTIGSGDRLDFSALGDTVNVAARLGSVAGPGELYVSGEAWSAARAEDPAAEHRTIDVSGRAARLEVVVLRRS